MATKSLSGSGFILSVFAASLLLTAAGCRGKHERSAIVNEEQPAATAPAGPVAAPAVAPAGQLASVVKANDPATASQLVSGFYVVEGNAWRWTEPEFAVNLKIPSGAAQSGAILKLAMNVPEPVVNKVGAVTLTASAKGAKLGHATWAKAGPYTFTADVPASMAGGDTLNVKFALDKFLPGSAQDSRKLGIIVSSISLEAKAK